jgi:hypothetical protein
MQKTEPKNQESKTCGNENQGNSKTKYINKIRDYLDKKMSQPTQFALFLVIVLLLIVTVIPEFMVYASMLHYNDTALANMQISASCNLIIAFITLLYVILTGYLVLESREMRKLQTEPKLYLFIETREKDYDITDLFIQNIGMGPAYNIEFEVLSDFIYGVLNIDKDGYALPIPKNLYASKASIVKNGIKYLAPNQKKRIFSTMLLQTKNINLQNNLDNHLEIKITYEDNLRVSTAVTNSPLSAVTISPNLNP